MPFESFLVADGIHFVKLWLSGGREEQAKPLERRRSDPLKQWKLSPIDDLGPSHWEHHMLAALDMFSRSDSPDAPWWFVNNNDKRVARLTLIQRALSLLPYDTRDARAVGEPRSDVVAPVRPCSQPLRPTDHARS